MDDSPFNVLNQKGKGLFQSYIYLKEYKIWPVAGGLSNQSKLFLNAVELMDSITQKYQEWDAIDRQIKAKQGKKNGI